MTDIGSWRWTMFINVPIGARRPAPRAALRHRDPAPARTFRRRRRGVRHRWRGRDRLVADRRPRPRLDLRPDHRRPRRRRRACWPSSSPPSGGWRTRCCGPPAAQPAAGRRHCCVIALVFGAQLSMFFLAVQYVQQVLGFGPLASGFAFLPLTVGIFAMSRFTPRLVARYGPVRLQLVGLLRAGRQLRRGSARAGAGDTYAGAIFGPMLLNGAAAGLVFMPTTVLDPRRRRARARRRRLRPDADHAAARRRGRPGRDRVGVRRRRRTRRVPAGCAGGLPHLGAARPAGRRCGADAGTPPGPGGAEASPQSRPSWSARNASRSTRAASVNSWSERS